MVDKRRDNRTSDDLLADLDALEELLGPVRSPASGSPSGSGPGPAQSAAPARAPELSGRRSQAPKEGPHVAKKDGNGKSPESGPRTGGKRIAEEQIPLLEDVVLRGVRKKAEPSRSPEPKPQLPSRAEIDSWVELAIETRLEPLKKQLRRELWEELLRRFPALREEGR